MFVYIPRGNIRSVLINNKKYQPQNQILMNGLLHHEYNSLMQLSPSSEAANCAATQELPSIL
jgi:hypothetical protein